MYKKLAVLFAAVTLIAASAFAGNIPEFDAVGDDSANFFNDFVKDMVVANNIDTLNNVSINEFSDFPYDPETGWGEFFESTGSGPDLDPCFPGYISYKAGPWYGTSFEWQIVLQMIPETDLALNIRDCVLKENQMDIWHYAQQTARWRQSNGKLVFAKAKNPRITVAALPGPKQNVMSQPFCMDARKMPGLGLASLNEKLYTSIALWEEGIIMKMPEPGTFNEMGQPVFVLREGDQLNVKIEIPWDNPVDIWYGQDNIVVKYVGILGTDLTTLDL